VAVIHVPQSEAAPMIRQLLAAAQELGLSAAVVKTASDGVFGFSLVVPDEVLAKAQAAPPVSTEDEPEEPVVSNEDEPEEPAPKRRGRPRKPTAEPVVEEQE
jgi:hypothetical protein